MAANVQAFVLEVFFWLAVLAILLAFFAVRTRRRLRDAYPVKLSELSEGLKSLEKGHHIR